MANAYARQRDSVRNAQELAKSIDRLAKQISVKFVADPKKLKSFSNALSSKPTIQQIARKK